MQVKEEEEGGRAFGRIVDAGIECATQTEENTRNAC